MGQGESAVSCPFRPIRKTGKPELRGKTRHFNDFNDCLRWRLRPSMSLRRVIIPWDAYNQVLIDVYQYSVVVDLLLQCPKQKTS